MQKQTEKKSKTEWLSILLLIGIGAALGFLIGNVLLSENMKDQSFVEFMSNYLLKMLVIVAAQCLI